VAFDLTQVEALSETESERTKRQVALVQAGILTPEEARRERGLS
jgi:phage portal protein BeeE